MLSVLRLILKIDRVELKISEKISSIIKWPDAQNNKKDTVCANTQQVHHGTKMQQITRICWSGS